MSGAAQATVEVSALAEPGYGRIMLASEGREIPDAAIARVAELADRSGPATPACTCSRSRACTGSRSASPTRA